MFMNIFYVFANISSYNYFVLFLFIKEFIVVIKESKEIILVQLSFIIPQILTLPSGFTTGSIGVSQSENKTNTSSFSNREFGCRVWLYSNVPLLLLLYQRIMTHSKWLVTPHR